MAFARLYISKFSQGGYPRTPPRTFAAMLLVGQTNVRPPPKNFLARTLTWADCYRKLSTHMWKYTAGGLTKQIFQVNFTFNIKKKTKGYRMCVAPKKERIKQTIKTQINNDKLPSHLHRQFHLQYIHFDKYTQKIRRCCNNKHCDDSYQLIENTH